jgi:hypothetical protein
MWNTWSLAGTLLFLTEPPNTDFCQISVSGEHFKNAVWAGTETCFLRPKFLRLLMSHFPGVKFHWAFMDSLKRKVKLHYSEGPLMKNFHCMSSKLHESLVVILQRFKFWGHTGCTLYSTKWSQSGTNHNNTEACSPRLAANHTCKWYCSPQIANQGGGSEG